MSKIHHYTSIENLALILNSKSLRFTRLDFLDDLSESKEFGKYNPLKYSFVSCWTKDEKENIALWKMYSSLEKGVKLTFENDFIFNYYDIPVSHFLSVDLGAKCHEEGKLQLIKNPEQDFIFHKSPLTPEQFFNRDYMIPPFVSDILFKDIVYDDNYVELYKKAIQIIDGNIEIAHSNYGEFKSKYWEFQKESRFIIHTLPMGSFKEGCFSKRALENSNLSTEYIDVNISDIAFSGMTVTLAPLTEKSHEIIVKTLLSKFPAAKIQNSELKGIIRR